MTVDHEKGHCQQSAGPGEKGAQALQSKLQAGSVAHSEPEASSFGFGEVAEHFLVATADSSAEGLTKALGDLLHNVRTLLDMDIAFVAEFVEGRRIFRQVSSTSESASLVQRGHSHALEDTYCQRVVDGRLPRAIQNSALLPEALRLEATRTLRIAAYLSAPVVLPSGEVYGTLCCISHEPRTSMGPLQVDALRSVAEMVAKELQRQRDL